MTSNKRIVYLGRDLDFYSELFEQLGSHGYQLEQLDNLEGRVEETLGDWYQLLVLDIDLTNSKGFELLRGIKRYDAGVPLIVIAERDKFPLSQISVARLNGAEALFFKPLTHSSQLIAVVEDAFCRLCRWQASFKDIAQPIPSSS